MTENNISNRLTAVTGEDSRMRVKMRVLLLGVFLLSFSLLALQVALTRFLSVMLSYHYVFMVVSLASLGQLFPKIFLEQAIL